MSVHVYGCNHIAIEVDDIRKAVAFYKDVFNLEKLDSGEGDAFFKLGEHQFLAIFEVEKVQPDRMRHFGLIVRDEQQIAEVRKRYRQVQTETRAAIPLRFSRPMGKSHSGRRSARRIAHLALALPRGAKGRNQIFPGVSSDSN